VNSVEMYISTSLCFELEEMVEAIREDTWCDELYTEVVLPIQEDLTREDSYRLVVEVLSRLGQAGDSAQDIYTELFTRYGEDRGWVDPAIVDLAE
jgi:hypothetical protein